jgi:hypothetical protein
MLMFSVASVADRLPPWALLLLRKKAPTSPLASVPWPGAANWGGAVSATMAPPMLSPPTLTGAMPAKTLILATLVGSR